MKKYYNLKMVPQAQDNNDLTIENLDNMLKF